VWKVAQTGEKKKGKSRKSKRGDFVKREAGRTLEVAEDFHEKKKRVRPHCNGKKPKRTREPPPLLGKAGTCASSRGRMVGAKKRTKAVSIIAKKFCG